MITIMLASALAILVAVTLLWLLSLMRRDASLIDAFWGPGFALVAAVSLTLTPVPSAHAWLLAGMTTLWAFRLGFHLLRRNLAHGEDRRYRAMREAGGPSWPRRSYVTVFLLQGALMWLISLTLQVGIACSLPVSLGHPLVVVGAGLFLFGFVFEAVADAQMWHFRQSPQPRGAVMDRGLWRWSRHPNYFGEACVWWGLYLAACAAPWAALTVCGPLLVTVLLTRISGVPTAESGPRARSPEYAAYAERTSAFVPRPPRH